MQFFYLNILTYACTCVCACAVADIINYCVRKLYIKIDNYIYINFTVKSYQIIITCSIFFLILFQHFRISVPIGTTLCFQTCFLPNNHHWSCSDRDECSRSQAHFWGGLIDQGSVCYLGNNHWRHLPVFVHFDYGIRLNPWPLSQFIRSYS